MLTKEERGAIAERIKSVDYVDEKTFDSGQVYP